MDRKILIIEDDADFSSIVSSRLSAEGYTVTQLPSGTDGLIEFRKNRYDLIIVDIELKDTDGFEVIKCINDVNAEGDTGVLILSSHKDLQTRLDGLSLGSDDYLAKPVNLQEMVARIKNIFLKQKRKEFQLEESRAKTLHDLAVSVCHEINNPLVEILLKTQYVRDKLAADIVEKNQFVTLLGDVIKKVEALSCVTKQLAEAADMKSTDYIKGVSMMDLDKSSVTLRQCDIDALIKQACLRWDDIAREKKVALCASANGQIPQLWLDKEKIDKVLDIIISAALVKAAAKDSISINLLHAGNVVELQIEFITKPHIIEGTAPAGRQPFVSPLARSILKFHGTHLRHSQEDYRHIYSIKFTVEKRLESGGR